MYIKREPKHTKYTIFVKEITYHCNNSVLFHNALVSDIHLQTMAITYYKESLNVVYQFLNILKSTQYCTILQNPPTLRNIRIAIVNNQCLMISIGLSRAMAIFIITWKQIIDNY